MNVCPHCGKSLYDGPPYKAERAPSGRFHIFVPGEHYVGSVLAVGADEKAQQAYADEVAARYTAARDWPFKVFEKYANEYERKKT